MTCLEKWQNVRQNRGRRVRARNLERLVLPTSNASGSLQH